MENDEKKIWKMMGKKIWKMMRKIVGELWCTMALFW